MSTFRLGALWIAVACLALSCAGMSMADELVRGLVVDNGSKAIWLGLPVPVEKGTVFNVYLTPGGEPLARVTVLEITPDPPFVAKASVKLLRKDAFIPVGAYVEVTGNAIPATDKPGGYDAVDLHDETARRLIFRAGVLFLTGGDVKDETSSTWPAVQITYPICSKPNHDLQIGLGYCGGRGSFSEGGLDGTRDIQVVPLTLDMRIPMSYTQTGNWFARAGIGAYLIRDRRTLGAASTSEDVVAFGWQAGFGYISARGKSAEIHYTDVSRTDFQGLVFSLGTRF